MPTRFTTAFLLVALTVPGFSQTALRTIADRVWSQPLVLPASISIVSLTPADTETPRQAYTLTRGYAADGSFVEEWKTANQSSQQAFRADGTLVSSSLVNGKTGVTITQTSDARRTTVRTVIVQNGTTKSDKQSFLSPWVVLRSELPHLVIQSWRAGVRDGLALQSLSPDGGMTGDFQMVFRTTTNLTTLSNKYTYPDEFQAAFPAGHTYLVADMSLQGIGAFFFPHHFYLVYEATASSLEWRGYFGEDPKKPIFQFLKY